jgi:hypothetical protein
VNIYTRWTVEGKWLSEPPVGMKFVASHKVNGETVELYAESEGYQEGYKHGYDKGYANGRIDGAMDINHQVSAQAKATRAAAEAHVKKTYSEVDKLFAEAEAFKQGFEEGKKRQAVEKVPADDGAFEMSKMSLDWNSGYNWVLEEVIAKLIPKKENN